MRPTMKPARSFWKSGSSDAYQPTTGPNGNAGVDGMASVIAHDLEESTTDPDASSGWFDKQGAENADKCAWTFGQSSNLSKAPNGAYYNMILNGRPFLIQ